MQKYIRKIFVILGFTAFVAFLPLIQIQIARADFADILDDLGIKFEEEEVTTFEGFKGGLQPPAAEGLEPSLTRAKTAREFIVNVVNFALGFLGIAGVIIVIYGGVLYLTSGGGEGAEKGKKTIMYAVIGIVVILGSFAFVNTILQAPAGREEITPPVGERVRGPAETNLASIAEELASTYAAYPAIQQEISAIKIKLNEVEISIVPKESFNSQFAVSDAFENIKKGFQEVDAKLATIIQRGSILSSERELVEAQRQLITAYINYIPTEKNNILVQACPTATPAECPEKYKAYYVNFIENFKLLRQTLTEGTLSALKYTSINGQEVNVYKEILASLQAKGIENIGYDEIMKKVGEDFDKRAEELNTKIDEVVFKPVEGTISPEIKVLFAQTKENITTLKTQKGTIEATNTIKSAILNMAAIAQQLKDLKFVVAKIKTDKTEGNAPLIVNFSSLDSYDPSEQSIKDENITWDLDGDGFDTTTGPCDGVTTEKPVEKSVVACTYTTPGTYRVGLKIKSSDEKIAAGVAYATIKVEAPKTRIKLKVTLPMPTATIEIPVMEYDEKGFIKIDRPQFNVTLAQAQQGITFDASGSDSGAIKASPTETETVASIRNLRWDFGDQTEIIQGAPSDTAVLKPTKKYQKEGKYRVVLEVTDISGNVDRKIVNVNVGKIAAFISIRPDVFGKLTTPFKFDGSASRSDQGAISSFEWFATKVDTQQPVALLKKAETKFETQFKEIGVGKYNVSLTVKDPTGASATDTTTVTVESEPPVAKFSWSIPNPAQPATVVLDGAKTYDPDGPNPNLDYTWTIGSGAVDYTLVEGTEKSPKLTVKFKKKGEYAVKLNVIDKKEPKQTSAVEQTITIENTLDVSWGKFELSKNLTEGKANIAFAATSDNAVAYEIDFGDGSDKGTGSFTQTLNVSHTYTEAKTYTAKLTVFDAEDNEQTISRKIFIGSGDKLVAMISFFIDGNEETDLSKTITVNRKNILTFDAGKSINVDGTARRLNYSWDFRDGGKSTNKVATHTYKDLSPKKEGFFTIKLVVSDKTNPDLKAEDEVKIDIKSVAPTFKALSVVPQQATLTTPVKVAVTAIDAEDPDGKITQYRWWYYDVNEPELELGAQLTQLPTANLMIGTKGEEGQKKQYKFAVEILDNENEKTGSEEILEEEEIPMLEVTNGPNKPPIAKFSVDKTNINVGKSITFSSSSTDPDGKIAKYQWDVEGDGFHNNEPTETPTLTYQYTKSAKEGVNVRLKVTDDNFAETISDPIKVFVTSLTQPPKAAFTGTQTPNTKIMTFKNNSEGDPKTGATIAQSIWDFDTSVDSDGDGKRDNDQDSLEMNPTHEYGAFKTYNVKLIVKDNEDNEATITNPVAVTGAPAPTPTPIIKPTVGILDARLISTPSANPFDGKIHLKGESGDVVFDYSTSVGDIAFYIIDKNILFDTNGNGVKEDDEDHKSSIPGTWTAGFQKAWGKIVIRLTVIDKQGKKDFVDKEIVFDPIAGGTNVLAAEAHEAQWLLAVAAGFAILALSVHRIRQRLKKTSINI